MLMILVGCEQTDGEEKRRGIYKQMFYSLPTTVDTTFTVRNVWLDGVCDQGQRDMKLPHSRQGYDLTTNGLVNSPC